MRRGVWIVTVALIVGACGGGESVETSFAPVEGETGGESGATTAVASGEPIAFAFNRDRELLALDPEAETVEVIAEVESSNFLWTVAGEPWASQNDALIHFDAGGDELGRIALWGPQSLAVDGGTVWVVSLSQSTPNGILSKIDPTSHTVTADLLTEDGLFFDDVAAGDGLVWVSYSGVDWDSTVSAIDPDSVTVTNSVELPIDTRVMAYGEGSLWVAGSTVDGAEDDTVVVRVAADGTIEAEIPVGAPWLQLDILVAFGSVWVVDAGAGELIQIDPASNAEVARLSVGSPAPTDPRRMRVYAGSGSLWVDNAVDDVVYEIDPASGEQLSSFSHRAILFAFR